MDSDDLQADQWRTVLRTAMPFQRSCRCQYQQMSTLSFVPRSVKRRKVDDSGKDTGSSKPSTSKISCNGPSETPILPLKAEAKHSSSVQKEKQQDTDLSLNYAILVWLAMSDFSLWMDPDLRRTIAFHSAVGNGSLLEPESKSEKQFPIDEKGQNTFNDSGYVPLKYLLQHSPIFRLVSTLEQYRNVKETTYANALRSHARQEIDVRFILHPESSSSTRASVNANRGMNPQQSAGFEVRRKDLATSTESKFSRYNKADWDKLTLYFENIPFKCRHVAGVAKMTMSLLPPSHTLSTLQRVQNISYPPRHEGETSSIPTCKGFALVTLSCQEDVKALLDAWPWDRPGGAAPTTSQYDMKNDDLGHVPAHENGDITMAKTFGLRVCTKARWEELRAEYLLYRQQLVDEINQHQDAEDARGRALPVDKQDLERNPLEKSPERVDSSMAHMKRKRSDSLTAQTHHHDVQRPNLQFPSGCLVFVRHVHPETNKTTLRTLFSRAWEEGSDNKDVIHYVDYNKNMDSCYIRLSTPAHAKLFVDHFSNHPVVQSSGLDAVGSQVSSQEDSKTSSKPILPELVLGKREEVYWEKVPEKLRKQAVEKLLKAMNGGEENGNDQPGSSSKKRMNKKKRQNRED